MTIAQKISSLFNINPAKNVGLDKCVITEKQNQLGINKTMPKVLKDFYLALGNYAPITQSFNTILLPNEISISKNGYIIICVENQYAVHWGIKASDWYLENPPVYACYDNDLAEWFLDTHQLDHFLILMAIWNGVLAGFSYSANKELSATEGKIVFKIIESRYTEIKLETLWDIKVFTDNYQSVVVFTSTPENEVNSIYLGGNTLSSFTEITNFLNLEWDFIQNDNRSFSIDFQLNAVDNCAPFGFENGKSISWFGLTDGIYALQLGNQRLYEYSQQANIYFELNNQCWVDYQIVRFIEDFTNLFESINRSLPSSLFEIISQLHNYQLAVERTLGEFFELPLDENNETFETDDTEYQQTMDSLLSWIHCRTLYAFHLMNSPEISFFRHQDTLRIVWKTDQKLPNEQLVWSAKNGSMDIYFDDFVASVENFGHRFFAAMDTQVAQALNKDWEDIILNKDYLVKEHQQRKIDFQNALSILKNSVTKETDCRAIEMIKKFNLDSFLAKT